MKISNSINNTYRLGFDWLYLEVFKKNIYIYINMIIIIFVAAVNIISIDKDISINLNLNLKSINIFFSEDRKK